MQGSTLHLNFSSDSRENEHFAHDAEPQDAILISITAF